MLSKNHQQIKTRADKLPVGTFIETKRGYFFVKSQTARLLITSKEALDSWSPQRVVQCDESDPAVSCLKITSKLKFRNGSLIWSIADGRLYLIESGKKRWVTSPKALHCLGYQVKDLFSLKGVILVSKDDIELHETGEILS